MTMKDVSIIIVNYNTRTLLADCIESILCQTYGVSYEIIVVDNASTDDSRSYITEKYTQIKWVDSGGNIGFGRANNLGVKYAQGKYLFLLNSDTILKNNAIKIFHEYMNIHAEKENIGALGCQLYDNQGLANLSYGSFPSVSSEIFYLLNKLYYRKKTIILQAIDVDYITGADIFIPKKIFEKMGGFDPNFFMYYEETDLQYRMAKHGWIRRIITSPHIIHLEGGSFKKKGLSLNRFIISQQSYNYYIRKHYKSWKYIFFRISLILLRLQLFTITNWKWKDKIKAYSIVLKG